MSLLREIKLVLDFHSPTIRTLTLHQYDKNSTNIIVTCMDNGVIKKIDHQSVNAYLKWKKPDGNDVLNDEIVNEDGTITIECSQQMLAADGRISAELCLVDATTQEALHTMPFFVVNKKSVINDEEITSTSEYGALVNALIDAKSVEEFAQSVPEWEEAEQQRRENEILRQQNTATAIANCEQATENANNAADAANTAAQNANSSNTTAQTLITQMTEQLETVSQSITDASTATDAANTITSEMTQLKTDLETAEATRVENENTRKTNETARQELSATMQGQLDSVSTAVSDCETATTNANTAADRANKAAQDVESIISGEIPVMSEEFIRGLFA